MSSHTFESQEKLARYVRTGEQNESMDLGLPQNLSHYRRLVFNVVFDTLATAYPITRKLLDRRWKDLVDRFFRNHDCQNYQVWRMPEEFMHYTVKNEAELMQEYSFLEDLLLFEWTEIEVYSEEDKIVEPSGNQDLLHQVITLNPHFRILQLSYPVFTRDYDSMNDSKGQYFLLIIRDPADLKVKFMSLSPLMAATLDLLTSEKSLSLVEAVQLILREQSPEVETIENQVTPIVDKLSKNGMFLL